jgi:hypothetical protein
MSIQAFKIDIAEAILDDLRQRFQRCDDCPHALNRGKVAYLQSAEK